MLYELFLKKSCSYASIDAGHFCKLCLSKFLFFSLSDDCICHFSNRPWIMNYINGERVRISNEDMAYYIKEHYREVVYIKCEINSQLAKKDIDS